MHAARRATRLAAIVLGLLAAPVGAADLHFILVAETNDPAIGTIDDLVNARAWAETIAANTGLALNLQTCAGDDVTLLRVSQVVNNLDVTSDDVVYFYYSGHGGNPDHRKWPVMYFLSSIASGGGGVAFDDVVTALQAKGPRLLIVLADCCNNYFDEAGRYAPRFDAGSPNPLEIENFRRLFVDFEGTVLASGSSPGEYSLGGEGFGGLFTNTFMDVFMGLARTRSDLTWDEVLSQASINTAAEAATVDHVDQHPQFAVVEGLVLSQTPDELDLGEDAGTTGDDTTNNGDDGASNADDGTGTTNGDANSSNVSESLATPAPLCGMMSIATSAFAAAGLLFMPRPRRPAPRRKHSPSATPSPG